MRQLELLRASILCGLTASTLFGCGFTAYKNSPGAAAQAAPIPAASAAPITQGTTSSTSTSPPASSDATFTQVNTQILQAKCIGCHSAGSSPDFSSYTSFATNTQWVQPGDASASALYTQVQSGSMPKGGTPLSADEVTLIYNWIQNGAQND